MKLATMIVVLGIFVVLPVIIVALVTRAKTHAINKRAEIALAAIEKMFASQERVLAVKRAYFARFKEKLTPQQLFRLFRPKNERRRAAQGPGQFGPGMPPPPGMGGGFRGRPGF